MSDLQGLIRSYTQAWRDQNQDAATDILDQCPPDSRESLLAGVEAELSSSEVSRAESDIRTDRVAASLRELGTAEYVIDGIIRGKLESLEPQELSQQLITDIPALATAPAPRLDRMARRIINGTHPLIWCSTAVRHTLARAADVSAGAIDALARSEPPHNAPIAARNSSATFVDLPHAASDGNDIIDQEFFANV